MTQVRCIDLVLCYLFFTYFLVNPNQAENTTERSKRRHNSSADHSSSNNDISRKERFPSNLEYRLMRMEVQFVEKFDRINSEIRENNNRLQNLEWQYAETQRSIDGALPLLESYLRQQPHYQQPAAQQSAAGTIDDRLNKLAEATANLIATSRVFYRDLAEIKGNLSTVAVMTKNMYDGSPHFVTSSALNKALMNIQSSSNLIHQPLANNRTYPSNCLEILNSNGASHTGIHQIRSNANPNADPIMVYCDMSSSGGGWTVIQRRYDGSQDFYRPWLEYKLGFGNIGGEFWLGLENIHDLTGAAVNELLVELEDQDGVTVSAHYGAFSIASELERYRLRVLADYQQHDTNVYEQRSGYSSSSNDNNAAEEAEDGIGAGDSLSYHAGSRFSTFDVDEDNWPEGNCAQSHGGGWWYNQCDRSNLNGRYLQPVDQTGEALLPEQLSYQGMYWQTFHGPRYSLRKSRMLIRPTTSYQTSQDQGRGETMHSGKLNDDDELDKTIADVFDGTD